MAYPPGVTSLTDAAGPRGSTRLWEPSWPVPVGAILAQQRHGGGDPTYKVDFQGRHWRGLRTPEGDATLMVDTRLRDGAVYTAAWGEGADWALESVPGAARRRRRPDAASSPTTRSSPTSGATTATGGSAAAAW